ncbi:MAG: hypothetical protein R3D44_11175 [Hyphomicrobiaceae bacterium]
MIGDVVIGPHSGLTRWVFDVVTRLAELAGRPVRVVDRHDPIRLEVGERPVFLTHYPSAAVIEAIERRSVTVTLVMEDSLDSVTYLRSALSKSVLEIVRALTATSVANLAIAAAEDVLFIDRGSERAIGEHVARLARQLGIDLGQISLADSGLTHGLDPVASTEALLAARGDHYAAPVRLGRSGAIDAEMMVAVDVVDPLLAFARGDFLRPVVWPTSVFKAYDRPDEPARKAIEVAGPARNIYYGPYFYLPPARYRVEVILDFSDEISDVPFVLEMHGVTWLTKAKIEERRSGHYRGYFFFDHTNSEASVEIRLRNDRAVAKGSLSLIEMLFFVQQSE